MDEQTQIYVLPTEGDRPPRALLLTPKEDVEIPDIVKAAVEQFGIVVQAMEEIEVAWSRDMGSWVFPTGMPVPEELGEAITEHAKELGVKW